MRKRISCRVIESIPLGHRTDGVSDSSESSASDSHINDSGGPTHTIRPAVTRLYLNDPPTTGILDLYI